ncbi:MAG: hypothetical protein MO852_17285, partial [Candidatus Devosia euplotis]|nr:hypothetical protein [Candidatus Devosia euplotis]
QEASWIRHSFGEDACHEFTLPSLGRIAELRVNGCDGARFSFPRLFHAGAASPSTLEVSSPIQLHGDIACVHLPVLERGAVWLQSDRPLPILLPAFQTGNVTIEGQVSEFSAPVWNEGGFHSKAALKDLNIPLPQARYIWLEGANLRSARFPALTQLTEPRQADSIRIQGAPVLGTFSAPLLESTARNVVLRDLPEGAEVDLSSLNNTRLGVEVSDMVNVNIDVRSLDSIGENLSLTDLDGVSFDAPLLRTVNALILQRARIPEFLLPGIESVSRQVELVDSVVNTLALGGTVGSLTVRGQGPRTITAPTLQQLGTLSVVDSELRTMELPALSTVDGEFRFERNNDLSLCQVGDLLTQLETS